jgi:hypothetical protein
LRTNGQTHKLYSLIYLDSYSTCKILFFVYSGYRHIPISFSLFFCHFAAAFMHAYISTSRGERLVILSLPHLCVFISLLLFLSLSSLSLYRSLSLSHSDPSFSLPVCLLSIGRPVMLHSVTHMMDDNFPPPRNAIPGRDIRLYDLQGVTNNKLPLCKAVRSHSGYFSSAALV